MRILAASLLLLVAACGESPPISVADAWVRASPPGATATAGYFDLVNGTDRALRIEEVTSPRVGRIELHETRTESGMMRMRRLSAVGLPAGGRIEFTPGGRHLMLFSATLPAEGEVVALSIHFDDGTRLDFEAPVRRGID